MKAIKFKSPLKKNGKGTIIVDNWLAIILMLATIVSSIYGFGFRQGIQGLDQKSEARIMNVETKVAEIPVLKTKMDSIDIKFTNSFNSIDKRLYKIEGVLIGAKIITVTREEK